MLPGVTEKGAPTAPGGKLIAEGGTTGSKMLPGVAEKDVLTNPSRVTYQPGALTTPFSVMPQNSSFAPHTNLPKLTIKKFDGDLSPGPVITPTSAARGGSPGSVSPSNMTFPPVTVNAPFSDGAYMLTNPSRVTYQPGALTTPFSVMPQNTSHPTLTYQSSQLRNSMGILPSGLRFGTPLTQLFIAIQISLPSTSLII